MTEPSVIHLADIKTVTPAVRPAFLRIVMRWEFGEEGESMTREWGDIELPVLGYGVWAGRLQNRTFGDFRGLYLVADSRNDGPCWLAHANHADYRLVLSIDRPSGRGEAIPGFCDGYAYTTEALDGGSLCDLEWVVF